MLCAAFLADGCATSAVWGKKDCKPSVNGNLSLAFAPEKHDFLVKYDELRGTNVKTSTTKSYWLFAYSDNPPKSHGPDVVQDTDSPEMTAIPILKWNDPMPKTGYSAIYFPREGTFDLYHDGVDIGRFTLPNYSTPGRRVTFSRVLLTPPAIIADTLMVGGIIAIYAAPYVAEAYTR
jgi:hypothetical protein